MRSILLTAAVATISFGPTHAMLTGSMASGTALSINDLQGIRAGTFYYCATVTPAGESGCADCKRVESGDWVRCNSENQQLSGCDDSWTGPAPSPYCEDWTQDCGGTVWVYMTETDCDNDTGRDEPGTDCERTYVTVKSSGQAPGVSCQ